MKNIAKQTAKDFMKEFRIKALTVDRITEIIISQGFRIIRFNKVLNENNVEILINGLELQDYVNAYSAFTYVDERYRLLFLEENLSDDEILILLVHEEGHIYNQHFERGVLAGENTKDEYEANEFAHYVLNPTLINKFNTYILTHKKSSIIFGVIIFIIMMSSIAIPQVIKYQSYYGDYYVVPTGTKFHIEECFYVRDKNTKRRLTQDDIKSGLFEPCKVCLPELREEND